MVPGLFHRHVVWEQNHHLRIFRQSDWESGKQQKKKLKSERKTVNYEMTMKNMKRENLLEKLRKEGRKPVLLRLLHRAILIVANLP